ncbi:MAG: hypothetical protein ACJAUO_000501 [Sediminicola sp.]
MWVFCFTKMPKLIKLEGGFGKQKTKTRLFSVAQGFYACTGYLLGIIENNPSFSAKGNPQRELRVFCFTKMPKLIKLEGVFGKQKTKTRLFSVAQGFYACTGYLLGIIENNPSFYPKSHVIAMMTRLLLRCLYWYQKCWF